MGSPLKNIKKFIPQGKILDIGCAFGGFLQVASQYYPAYGLDISQYAIEKGIQWAKNKQIPKSSLSLYQGDLLHIPNAIKNNRLI